MITKHHKVSNDKKIKMNQRLLFKALYQTGTKRTNQLPISLMISLAVQKFEFDTAPFVYFLQLVACAFMITSRNLCTEEDSLPLIA